MTPEEHIRVAVYHLEAARRELVAEHKADGIGSKSRPLRFVENALLALSQVWGR